MFEKIAAAQSKKLVANLASELHIQANVLLDTASVEEDEEDRVAMKAAAHTLMALMCIAENMSHK